MFFPAWRSPQHSILPEKVKIMALTATATKSSREHIISVLQMNAPKIVAVIPSKDNIKYSVRQFQSIEECVAPVVGNILKYGTACDKTIVFCSKREICSYVFIHMKSLLGSKSTYPCGAPFVSELRLFDCYTAAVDDKVKNHIVSSFTNSSSKLRVVIGTIAFGMGLDCPDIRNIIHIGAPETVEDNIQQTGRAGRDAQPCFAVLYHGKGLTRMINKDMQLYCSNKSECRKEFLLKFFEGRQYICETSTANNIQGSHCCDICLPATINMT